MSLVACLALAAYSAANFGCAADRRSGICRSRFTGRLGDLSTRVPAALPTALGAQANCDAIGRPRRHRTASGLIDEPVPVSLVAGRHCKPGRACRTDRRGAGVAVRPKVPDCRGRFVSDLVRAFPGADGPGRYADRPHCSALGTASSSIRASPFCDPISSIPTCAGLHPAAYFSPGGCFSVHGCRRCAAWTRHDASFGPRRDGLLHFPVSG